jgi:SagB-type dehydrogenase family enzyme
MSALVGVEDESGDPVVSLPTSVRLRREVGDTIETRRSCRLYTGDSISLAYLATLVRHAAEITAWEEVELLSGERESIGFRSAPSGGALYPIDLYCIAQRVDRLPRRVYRYSPRRDVLIEVAPADTADAILKAFAVPEDLINLLSAAAIFLLMGHPWRSLRKYGSRGGRYLFLEAGGIAENIHLSAHALGLGSVACASVYDDEIHEALKVDGIFESLLHTIVVGQPG